jgi:antibiotic biosynthesis monooxygenase (ABM) superfamily enzyme
MLSFEHEEPATLVEGRVIKPGREHEYHAWVQRAIAASEKFPGNEGVTVLAPEEGKPGVRYVVHRFSNQAAEQLWLQSEERAKLAQEAAAFSTPHMQTLTGMAPWFVLPEQSISEVPPKWKMSLTLIPAAYVISTVVVLLLDIIIPHGVLLINNLIVTVLLSFLLTYVGIPISTYLLRSWLYSQRV